MSVTEKHNAIVTRNTDVDKGVELRGAVFFEAVTLMDGEYPLAAIPCFPFASQGGAGFFFVPKVGDEIEILIQIPEDEYDNTDVTNPEPRWICGVYGVGLDIAEEFKNHYPFTMGWKSNSGHILLFDDFEGEELVKLAHTVGTLFQMESNGNYVESIPKDKLSEILGKKDTLIRRSKDEEIFGDRNLDIKGSESYSVKGNSDRTINVDENYTVVGKQTFVSSEVEQSIGTLTQNISGSKQVFVDGGVSETVGGSKSINVVSNFGTTVAGDKSSLVAGANSDTYGTGHAESIAAGDYTQDITLGDWLVSLIAGKIDLSNALAALKIDALGGVDLSNLLGGFESNATGITKIAGTTITLGAMLGNVLTTLTAPVVDNITGAPHIGVPTLFAG